MPDPDLVPAVLAALAVVLVPGALVGVLLRLRGVLLLGLAGPISVAIVAASAVVTSWFGLPFGWWTVLAASALGCGAAALVSRTRHGGAEYEPHDTWSRGALLTLPAAAIATIAIAVIALPGAVTNLPSQTYDGVFHLNAVAYILDTSNGSSFDLYRMTHPLPGGVEFYPAAWHDLVAIVVQASGAGIPAATAATWIVTSGTVFALGSAFFASEALSALPQRDVVAPVAALAASVGAAAPYLLLSWGVLYPTALAYSLLPAGIGLVLRFLRARRRSGSIALLAVWLTAAALAHPRSLPSVAIVIAPLLLSGAIGWIRAGLGAPESRRRTIVVSIRGAIGLVLLAAAAAAAVLVYFGAGTRPVSDRLNGGPATARQSFGESLLQALLIAPPSGPGESTLPPSPVLVVLLLVALVVCVMHPSTRWLVGAFALTAVLYALSAGSNSDFAKIATGLWYKDKYRLFAVLGTLSPVLIAAGVASLAALVTRIRASPRGRRYVGPLAAAALTLALAITSWFGPTLGGMQRAVASTVAVSDTKDGRLLDRDELTLLEQLPVLIPETNDIVVGNPWNGSVLSWAVGGREALFPHMIGDWDPDRQIVLDRLDQAAADPEVCAALDRLGAHYLFASDGLLWNGDPQAEVFGVIDRASSAVGFTEIARSGGSALYRITACDD